MLKIDWSKPLTYGRQVYAHTLDGEGGMHGVNYSGGFIIGWDRWSDGDIALHWSVGL